MLPIMNESLCGRCTGLCCHYITVEIDKPRTQRNHDDIRWYLLHEGITLLISQDRWLVKLPTRCQALSNDFRCGIYETRPETCREYSTDNCDYFTAYEGWGIDYVEIETPEEYEKYLAARKRKRPAASMSKSPKPKAAKPTNHKKKTLPTKRSQPK
ncbi:MAG: YkgJ family cysteine cluster protein [bacterium]